MPPLATLYRFGEWLQQNDVVVHGVDTLVGVGSQVEELCEVAFYQLYHNGEGALAVQGGAGGDKRGIGCIALNGLDPSHAQCSLESQPIGLLDHEHSHGQRAHFVLTHVVEPQVQGEALGGSLEDQLSKAGLLDAVFEVLGQAKVIQPPGDGYLQDLRLLIKVGVWEVKCQLLPHVGKLWVVRAEEELPCVERPPRGIADLPVGLYDGVSGGEALLHHPGYVRKYLGKEGLAVFAEGQGIAVFGEAVYEVLGQIRPPRYPQLAEEAQASAVQPYNRIGPGAAPSLACFVELSALQGDLLGFPQELLLFVGREVLEDTHLACKPITRWIEVQAVPFMPLLGCGYQFIKSPCERGVYRRPRQRCPHPLRDCHAANLS